MQGRRFFFPSCPLEVIRKFTDIFIGRLAYMFNADYLEIWRLSLQLVEQRFNPQMNEKRLK